MWRNIDLYEGRTASKEMMNIQAHLPVFHIEPGSDNRPE